MGNCSSGKKAQGKALDPILFLGLLVGDLVEWRLDKGLGVGRVVELKKAGAEPVCIVEFEPQFEEHTGVLTKSLPPTQLLTVLQGSEEGGDDQKPYIFPPADDEEDGNNAAAPRKQDLKHRRNSRHLGSIEDPPFFSVPQDRYETS